MAKRKKPQLVMTEHDRRAARESIEKQVGVMINRCGWLRDQGRIEEARRLLARIERLNEELKGLR